MKFDGKAIKLNGKRKKFNIILSVKEIESLIDALPDDNEIFKFISNGGFSSVSFFKFFGKRAVIKNAYISTLHIGKKELQELDRMHKRGELQNVTFIVGDIFKRASAGVKTYGYYENFENVCNNNGWEFHALKNHVKILLFDTSKGKYVIETSSNFNENPKIEFFSFEKDDELFDFYLKNLFELCTKGGE